jgi:uncharacterized protein (DUF58 family)
MPINIDRNLAESLGNLEWMAKQAVEGFITGLHKSPFHGFSVEFAEHRLYNQGDSLRHLDWKLMARTDKMFLKRYEEETNLRCQLIIDGSASMRFPIGQFKANGKHNKLSFSIYSAAVLMELFKRQRDAVGLTMFQDQIVFNAKPATSNAHLQRLYHQLEQWLDQDWKAHEQWKTDVVQTLHQLAEESSRRSLTVLFSDLLDSSSKLEDLFAALQHLRYKKHEVVIFHVVDEDKEALLNFDSRLHTFIDPESGETIKLNPNLLQSEYQDKWRKWKNDIALKCNQFSIDFVEVDVSKGFQEIMTAYLIKRQKMLVR